MIPIDTIVSIKSGDEYGGKYTGKLGIIKKFTDDRVGVEFAGLKNHASKYGLFWFKKENVTPSLFDAPKRNDAIIPAALAPLLRQRRSWHGRGRRLPNEHNLYRRTAKWQNNHAHRNV